MIRSRTLPITKFGCSRSGSSKTVITRVAERREPAKAHVEENDEADDAGGGGVVLDFLEVQLVGPVTDDPGEHQFDGRGPGCRLASGGREATYPTTKNAMASTGKTERKPK